MEENSIEENKDKIKKKKRGRPRNLVKEPLNEDTPDLLMSKTNKSNEANNEKVTLKEISTLWNQIFSQYQSSAGVDIVKNTLSNEYEANPFTQNQRLKLLSSLPRNISKDDIEAAFSNPQDHEQLFRELGWYISSNTYIYYKMLRLAMDVPLFNYYAYPKYVDKDTMDTDSFKNECKLVCKLLDALRPKVQFKKIAMEVKREGKCSYVYRQSLSKEGKQQNVDFAILQKLPSDYIKYTAMGSDTTLVTSMDFMIFMQPGFSLSQYPEFFTEYYNELINSGAFEKNKKGKVVKIDYDKLQGIDGVVEFKNNRYYFWRQLPQDQVFCFGSDLSNVWQLPDTIGLFANLSELNDYRWLQGALTSSPLTNIMTAEVALNNDERVPGYNDTALSPDVILGFQDLYNSLVSGNSAGFFAPFKNFELHSLPDVPNSMNIYSSALQDTITSAGIAGLLTTETKPSVAMVKTSQLLAEAEAEFVTKQLESFVNVVLAKHLGLKNIWRCSLWGNIFTIENDIKNMRDVLNLGISSVLPKLLSAYGLDIESDNCINDWLTVMGTYDKFHMVKSAYQQSSNKVGRPNADDNNLNSDNTEASINQGTNTIEVREETVTTNA